MLERVIYKNHMNEEIVFGQDGVYVDSNDLHDFSWDIVSKNDRISGFKKGIAKKSIPIIIHCASEEEGILKKNRLFEIPEKDVLAEKYGQIIIGEYKLKCYIIGSKKSDYLRNRGMMKTSLTIATDLPSWVRETITTFGYGEGKEGKNLDFNNDFPYDYTSNLLGKELKNTNFVDTNFKINIYGPCENPEVLIGGHLYNVNVNMKKNEYLTIDSIEKTIVLTHEDGSTTNCFNMRNRESYVFQKIPSGISGVSSGYFKFDIILLEERSEPKWT